MIFCIQYPIADFRQLSDLATCLLEKPKWPLQMSELNFVHHFGGIKSRKQGGLLLLGDGGEDKICEAKRAVRFLESPVFKDKSSPLTISFKPYRRFFYDGKLSAKFELSFCNVSPYTVNPDCHPLHLGKTQTENLLNFFFNVKLKVPCFPNNNTAYFTILNLNIVKSISRLYNYATIKKGCRDGNIVSLMQYVRLGWPPIFFLEIEQNETVDIPFPAKEIQIPDEYNIQFSCWKYNHEGKSYPFYIIKKNDGVNTEKARYLRLYLLRLNALYTTLIIFLNGLRNIKIIPGSNASKILVHYIDNMYARISKAEANTNKYWHRDLVKFAKSSIEKLNPGEISTIETQLKDINCKRTDKINKILENIQ